MITEIVGVIKQVQGKINNIFLGQRQSGTVVRFTLFIYVRDRDVIEEWRAREAITWYSCGGGISIGSALSWRNFCIACRSFL